MMPIYDISHRLYFSYILSIFNETILPYTFKAQTANIFTLCMWKYADLYAVENAEFLNNEATKRNEQNRAKKERNKETKNKRTKRRNVFRSFVPAFCSFVSSFRCFIV